MDNNRLCYITKAQHKSKWGNRKNWEISHLPQIPIKKSTVKKSDAIVSIVFSAVLLILFNAAPQLMGVYLKNGGLSLIPVFNLTVLKDMIVLINITICLGIITAVVRLVSGKYTIRLAFTILALNTLALVLTALVFTNPAIWNFEVIGTVRNSFNIRADVPLELY